MYYCNAPILYWKIAIRNNEYSKMIYLILNLLGCGGKITEPKPLHGQSVNLNIRTYKGMKYGRYRASTLLIMFYILHHVMHQCAAAPLSYITPGATLIRYLR